jgi:hypothetical protein
MIEQITQALAAPFMEQVGVQGFAYGLLGLKTVKKMITFARDTFSGDDGSE